jgi:hypothetical protein
MGINISSGRWTAVAGGVLACAVMTAVPYAASAAATVPQLDNGGFESGTLSSWASNEKGGAGEGWSADQGRAAPVSGLRIPAPPEGEWQAVADQTGPGSHILYRDIVVGTDPLELDLTLWFRNRAGRFFTPQTLAPGSKRNQQLCIDLMKPTARIRSMAADDILATVFRTERGDTTSLAPTSLHQNLTPFAGQTVRLRIAEVDNQSFFQVGVDDVRPAPLPPCPWRCA